MLPESGATILILKACGSVIGAALALVFVPPSTMAGFWRRLTVSIPVGILFSWIPPKIIEFPETIEGVVAASCIMAFVAWWAAGSIKRIAETFNIKSKD